MSRRGLLTALLLPALSFSARANWITVWYASPGATYDVYQSEERLELTSAGTFKVNATGDCDLGLGNIRKITVAEGVTGTVNLYVLTPDGFYGACNVGWIDLSNATTGNIADLYVYLTLGPDPNDEPTRATAVTGTFRGCALCKDLHLQTVPAGGSVGTADYPLRPYYDDVDVYVHDPNATNAGSIHVEMIHDDNVAIAGSLTGLLYFHACH